jgi:hypothetical protein
MFYNNLQDTRGTAKRSASHRRHIKLWVGLWVGNFVEESSAGLILGFLYLGCRKNLAVPIVAHGVCHRAAFLGQVSALVGRSLMFAMPARDALRNRKPEGSTLSGYARNLRKECAGLVAGHAVPTAENG